MQRITHIEALSRFAIALEKSASTTQKTESPISLLAKLLGLDIKSHKFARIMTWVIAFYYDTIDVIKSSSISEKNRDVALRNIGILFAPFLPPFPAHNLNKWYSSALSATNESYFDLLSDTIRSQYAINLPETSDIEKMKSDLSDLMRELKKVGLPKWINDDFEESLSLTFIALDKMPFLAHRIINDAHASILSKLFSGGTTEQRTFMVKVATTVNVILAAFVMPHAGYEAANTYYGWIAESPSDVKQIAGFAKPLALPAPSPEESETGS